MPFFKKKSLEELKQENQRLQAQAKVEKQRSDIKDQIRSAKSQRFKSSLTGKVLSDIGKSIKNSGSRVKIEPNPSALFGTPQKSKTTNPFQLVGTFANPNESKPRKKKVQRSRPVRRIIIEG